MSAFVASYFVFIYFLAKCYHISSQTLQDINLGVELEPAFQGSISNVTYSAGREAMLTCTVKNLGKYKVGWLRAADQTVLALQDRVVTHNARISISHENYLTWRLRIKQLRETDKGCYMCQINSSPMKKQIGCIDVQIPPDIINEDSSMDMAVQEGEDAALTCRATGNPIPRVTWKKENGDVIYVRKQGNRDLIRVDLYNGSVLRLTRLERKQMGTYLCIASNDVPPAVSKRVSLSVHFAPSVRAPSQLLGAPLGSDVQLNCQVEASPAPVSYWLKGGKLPNTFPNSINSAEMGQPKPEMLLDGPKYGITEQRNGYKGIMRLTIRSFSSNDVGTYHCVNTNSLGRAEGTLRLYEIKIHPGTSGSDGDQLNIIGGMAEEAKGTANTLRIMSHQTLFVSLITAFMIESYMRVLSLHSMISLQR